MFLINIVVAFYAETIYNFFVILEITRLLHSLSGNVGDFGFDFSHFVAMAEC